MENYLDFANAPVLKWSAGFPTGGTGLVTFLISAAAMILCLLLVVKLKLEKLKEFSLAIGMPTGTTGAVLWTTLAGM